MMKMFSVASLCHYDISTLLYYATSNDGDIWRYAITSLHHCDISTLCHISCIQAVVVVGVQVYLGICINVQIYMYICRYMYIYRYINTSLYNTQLGRSALHFLFIPIPHTVGTRSIMYTVHTMHCTMYSVQCTLYNVNCTLYTVRLFAPAPSRRYVTGINDYTRDSCPIAPTRSLTQTSKRSLPLRNAKFVD